MDSPLQPIFLIGVDAILRFCALAAGWAGRDRLLAGGAGRAGLLLAEGGGRVARWRGRAGLFARGAAPGCSLDDGPPGWPLEEGPPC